MQNENKKVLVALSGGVDSSVSAALLKEEGYEVEGAFIKTWSPEWLPCTWRKERRDAMRVSAHLNIPFHTVDLSKEYEEKVANYFIEEYKAGNTPNPDVMCNKYVKFGGLFDFAMEKGFDYIATGHYARVRKNGNEFQLLKGVDENKDQTYFLWTLKQEQLSRILFPIGEYKKPEVRELAEKFDLPTAQKKDSQGVCFLGKLNMKEFLAHYIDEKKGDVLDENGNMIGEHDGVMFLTLGQRHGFTVHQKTPDSVPLYIIDKDVENNTITVAPENIKCKNIGKKIHLKDVNWISKPKKDCGARLRYRQKLFSVTLEDSTEDTCTVVPQEEQKYVSVGQSLVMYDGDVCLGGGVIVKTA